MAHKKEMIFKNTCCCKRQKQKNSFYYKGHGRVRSSQQGVTRIG